MPTDFETTAPAPPLATRLKDSAVKPSTPEARIVGFGNSNPAMLARKRLLTKFFFTFPKTSLHN